PFRQARTNAPWPIAGARQQPPHHRPATARPAAGHTAAAFPPVTVRTLPYRASARYKPANPASCASHFHEMAKGGLAFTEVPEGAIGGTPRVRPRRRTALRTWAPHFDIWPRQAPRLGEHTADKFHQ